MPRRCTNVRLGLSIVARVFVADATRAAPDMGEFMREGEDLAVEGLIGC